LYHNLLINFKNISVFIQNVLFLFSTRCPYKRIYDTLSIGWKWRRRIWERIIYNRWWTLQNG